MPDLKGMNTWLIVVGIGLTCLAACALHCGRGKEDPAGDVKRSARNDPTACIDGEAGLGYIRQIISFGPRHAGTPGLERTRAYIVQKLREFGLEPRRDTFVALTPHPELSRVEMANIIVDIDGPGTKKVLVGGHFDGKIIPGVTFKGANDGGSSTALLLELARCLTAHPPPCPVRLVFFDGEEALVHWNDSDSLYGSKHFAGELRAKGEVEQIAAAVIVDMVGDARLQLVRDSRSTPWVYNALKDKAVELGQGQVFAGPVATMEDDHIPLLSIGIPTALLIDFHFGPGWRSNAYWHTGQDTVDKLSPASLQAVGQILLATLPRLAQGSP